MSLPSQHASLLNPIFALMFGLMKNKGLIFVLLLVSVGLGIALVIVKKDATEQQQEAEQKSVVASNQVVSVKKQLEESETVNQTLETNLASARLDFSNKLAVSDASLRTAEGNLEKAMAEAKTQADSNALVMAQRDQKITTLENQNQTLDKEAESLRSAITNVQTRIAATQEKLAKSQGDKVFLLQELKTLQAEKEDMDKKLHDVTYVRGLLHDLKTEVAIARRLDWIRRGMYASYMKKGGEVLMEHQQPLPPPATNGANVELRERGGVKIQTLPATNAPPK
jgi:chromosome segregation ATPase